jgi:hopanoid biosynthesis associated radical SAM protein HpnH
VRGFFDEMMELGVEGMMVSPGYAYDKAPDQQSFLGRRKTNELFEMILSNRKKSWKFNMSPLFLEFLMGKRDFECTPWGSPAYNIFGWQKPCYLLQEGYYDSFKELISETKWSNYGVKSGNPKCQNCMVHCGYEPSAVDYTFSGVGGIWANVKSILAPLYPNTAAAKRLAEEAKKPHRPIERLVQLGIAKDVGEKSAA